ncbi:MAG: DNA repair protein RecO C-terminal domain-containing protein [Bacteroidales bacterium]|nr:DNA repair protein RecO C-terminal domain-containing protein [Bacteroidales bacterium]
MTASTELIILNTTKFRENQLVLHTLSRVHGRRSFLVRVGKQASMALFLPLNLLEGDVTENPKSTLWTVRNLSALHPLNGIRGNLHKNTMTLFMSEVLFRALREGAVEEGLFDWCRKTILTLDAMESDFSNYPIRFLLELAAALGFSPTFESVAPFVGSGLTGHIASQAPGTASHVPGTASQPSGMAGYAPRPAGNAPGNAPDAPGSFNHLRTLQAFLGATFSESMLIPLSGADRNAIAEELVRYLEFHTELPLNIRSLKVLRELYGA